MEVSERMSFTLEGEVGLQTDGGTPEVVQLLPAGDVRPKGKTEFVVDEEARRAIMDAFAKSKTDLVIDYEHQSLSGAEAPAAGWIKSIEDRGADGVWASVQWTDRAVEYLKAREYRYLSPVVLIRKKDRRAVELLGAGLTNLPAIDGMAPVANKSDAAVDDAKARVEEDATAAAYMAMYLTVLGSLGLAETAGADAAVAAVEALKSREGFVPVADHSALKAELKRLETESLVSEAVSAGRLTPSLIPWAREYAERDTDGFREFAMRSVTAVPVEGYSFLEGPAVDGTQTAVNRLLGITDGSFMNYMKAVGRCD